MCHQLVLLHVCFGCLNLNIYSPLQKDAENRELFNRLCPMPMSEMCINGQSQAVSLIEIHTFHFFLFLFF